MKPLAIYIHWPFCVSKCPYCDFNSRPLPDGTDEKRWTEAYRKELAFYAALLPERQISSIYFGGGTPSLMRSQTVQAVLEKIASLWSFADDCEITLEANPSSSETEKFKAFRAAGVNRLSLGVQSFNDETLRFLGRAHDAATARRAIESAAAIFDRFSFDLIYAWRGQTAAAWKKELAEALSFAPRHLSLYQLTIEPGTVFYKRAAKETLCVSEDEAATLFEMTQELLGQAGLPAYEISNHAAAEQESRHNLTYWRYGDYIGIGPGAHGRFVEDDGRRWAVQNLSQPDVWRTATQNQGQGAQEKEKLDAKTAQTEALLMGLRLVEGLSFARWKEMFSREMGDFLNAARTEELIRQGFLERTKESLRATSAGRQRLNALLALLSDSSSKTFP